MQNMNIGNAYRQELKGKILQAATSLFYQHGIKQVKMDDIANSLKISKRTLYEIYENKEVLLFEVLQRNEEMERDQLMEFDKPGTNVLNIIFEFYRLRTQELSRINPLFFEDIHKYPKLLSYVRKRHEQQDSRVIAFMKRGVDEGYFLSNLNYEIVHVLADAAGQAIMNNFLYKKYDIRELFKISVMLFIRGICTPKGVRMLDESIDLQ